MILSKKIFTNLLSLLLFKGFFYCFAFLVKIYDRIICDKIIKYLNNFYFLWGRNGFLYIIQDKNQGNFT